MKISRRVLLAFLLFIPILPANGKDKKPKAQKKDFFAFVGTYTNKTESKGIYGFRYDASTGKATGLRLVIQTPDPSFMAIHPSGKYLYAVNESGKSSMVTAFALDAKTGNLTQLNQTSSLGED